MIEKNLDFLAELRKTLRINHSRFDSEISDLVAAAGADLRLGGISEIKAEDVTDPLIRRAITLYVKAEFGLDNADSGKYRESYDMLKRHLMLSTEYTGVN